LTTTFLISYQRSKAESLGLAAKGGLMERAERMILLGVGLLSYTIFIPMLWIMLGLTAMTAAGRFWRSGRSPLDQRPQLRRPCALVSTVGVCAKVLVAPRVTKSGNHRARGGL